MAAPSAAASDLLQGLRELVRESVREVVREELAAVAESSPRPALVDRAGAAQALGISLGTLDKLRAAGALPEVRVFDSPRFDISDCVRALKEGKAGR